MGSPCAPVIMLIYRRPALTRQVFERVRGAKPSTLIVVADGPRDVTASEDSLVRETREVVATVDWDCTVHRVYSNSNLGLKKRVASGLDTAFELVDSAIILEDDCVPSASFFPFATELLEKYRDDLRVGTIAASSRVRGNMPSRFSYDFSSDLRIWGWATWARTWRGFSASGDLSSRFDTGIQDGVLGNLRGRRRKTVARMLRNAHSLDSWALPFLGHVVSRRYLHAVPEVNLVENVGFGGDSTHTKFESFVEQVPTVDITFPLRHPVEVKENPAVDEVEARHDRLFALRYVVSHPAQVLGRLIRYCRAKS